MQAVYPDLHQDLRLAAGRGVLLILNKLRKDGKVELVRVESQVRSQKADGATDERWVML